MNSDRKVVLRVYVGDVLPAHDARIEGESEVLRRAGYAETRLVLGLGRHPEIPDSWPPDTVQALTASGYRDMVQKVRKSMRRVRPSVVHTHGVWATLVVAIARLGLAPAPPLLVYEIHGAVAFEAYHRHGRLSGAVRLTLLYLLESLAALAADRLLLVSSSVRKYYPATRVKPGTPIPRAIAAPAPATEPPSAALMRVRRFAERARGRGRRIVVYSGGASTWQRSAETLALLRSAVSAGASAVIFTQDPSWLGGLEGWGEDQEHVFAASLPRTEVAAGLAECDIGVLLRDDSVVNRVAHPTKFVEYLAAGLHVITTPGAAVVAEAVARHDLGLIVDLRSAALEAVDWIGTVDRSPSEVARLRQTAERLYSWRALGPELVALYADGKAAEP